MWKLDQWLEATFGMSTVIDGYPNPIYMLLFGIPLFLLCLGLMMWIKKIQYKKEQEKLKN